MTQEIFHSQEQWVLVSAISDIQPLGARIVQTPSGKPIAIFRTAEDKICAVHDQCPHKGGPLSQGIIHGEQVTCPLHGWQINLNSGEAVAPDVGCVTSYPTIIKNDTIYLRAADLD